MTTALDIITLALKDSGVVGEGQIPSAETVNDSLITLTGMLAQWEIDGITPFAEVVMSQTANGAASYTLNIPYDVEFVVYSPDGQSQYPLQRITLEEFTQLYATPTGIPSQFTYQVGVSGGTLSLYPKPASGTIKYGVVSPLATALGLTSAVQVPPAYIQAVRFNLALLLAVTFGVPARPDIAMFASSALASIQRANIKQKTLPNLVPSQGSKNSFNIFTGQ